LWGRAFIWLASISIDTRSGNHYVAWYSWVFFDLPWQEEVWHILP
jgi:hypothetical protein